jgi:hypothetical protein
VQEDPLATGIGWQFPALMLGTLGKSPHDELIQLLPSTTDHNPDEQDAAALPKKPVAQV